MINNYFSVGSCNSSGATIYQKQESVSKTATKRNWLSWVTVLVMLFSFVFIKAQSISNYAFTTGVNGSLQDISSGNTNYLTGVNDDVSGTVQSLGFDFIFMGTKYTHFSANSNGQMQLHTSSTATAIGTNVSTALNSAILAPFTGDNEVNNGMRYKVIGSAPNRTFVLEWNQFYVNFVNLSNAGNMQVLLDETTGVITYVYGAIYNSSTSSQSRSISIASSNTATTVGSITIGETPTFVAGTTLVVNTIAAGVNPVGITPIANIGSVVDGSRRFFTFTPINTVSGDVANLTFSGVTQNGITINWDDNATNESAFIVTRATDAAFTQNVSTTSVASTTSAGTGTVYTSIQTGLSAGTNYYYKVVAIVEAGQSSGITGSQTTLSGATYYWTGATGGLFATLTNWNTLPDGTGTTPSILNAFDEFIIDGEGTTSGGALNIELGANISIGQFKVINNTDLNLFFTTTSAGTRTYTITGGPGDDFEIQAGSSISMVNALGRIAFAFTGSGNTGIIAGNYTAGGNTANVINTTGGTGTLVSVSGTITNNIPGSSGCITGSTVTLRFLNGSNFIANNATTGAPFVPLATWDTNSNLTITGLTTASSGPTNSAQSFGNLIYNCPLASGTMSFFTSTTTAVIKGNLIIESVGTNGGTGIFRATTSGTLTVNGNVLINQGRFQASSTTGTVIANGNTTIGANGILELSITTGTGGFSQRGATFTNDGVLTGTAGTLSFVNLTGSASQTLAGSGTVLTNIGSLNMQNTAGLTITHTNPIILARVNLFQGTITNSSKITFGTGLAVNCTTQIGSAGLTTPGGNFDSLPTFNLGTGTYSLSYQQESVSRTLGFEIPSTRIVNNVTVNNTNGITIAGGDLTTISSLALTNGIVSTGSNTLILGNLTTVGTLTGSSETAYVNGALTRSIANANTNTTFVTFPIGKAGVYTPIALAPATTSIALFKAESFGSNNGTENPSIIGLNSNRRFEALPVSGTFTDINVRLSDVGIVSTNIPVQAPTPAGAYATVFGSTATFAAGPPITITSNFPATSANYTGYLGIANSNACDGTPTPGATTATANGLCLGQSTTLGITTIPVGSGVTYQWQSSTDGISFTDILTANAVTLTVTPTESTFYRCNVTCAAGPSTGTSTAVQITFSNSVIATTPATGCGLGSLTLTATPSTGAAIKWYAASTGGSALGSGTSFTTPAISATTTFFAGAETSASGNATLGAGATNSSSTAASFFPGFWGGAKTQYIIKASELTAAGIGAGAISSIGFEPTTSGQTYQGFFVNIGQTTAEIATTTFINTNLSLVYAGTEVNDGFTPVANTVNTLTFGTGTGTSSSFNWDGVSNIVVSISWSRVPGASTANASTMKVDNVGFTSTNFRQRDNFTPVAMLNETSASSTSSNRPRFHFNGQVVCQSARVPVVATVTTPPALTLSTSTAAICNGSTSDPITITSGATDYISYTWSPATAVSGNATTGWVFNPTETTNYTLTASQAPLNIVANGDFSNALTGWSNFVQSPLAATFTAANEEANITGISTITGPFGQQGFIQLNQIFTPAQIASLEVGSSYKITFSARSIVNNRSLKVFFGENGGGFVPLHEQVYSLSTTNVNYETTVFVVGQTFGAMKLGFEMGLMNEDVFIDNVTLKKVVAIICNTTATVNVTVNPIPSPMTITPSPALVCVDAIQSLVVTGGTLSNVTILQENFNAVTNNWTTVNNTTAATDNTIPAWTLRPSGFAQGATFITPDASQFYLSNSDAAGSGNVTNVSLISPSFSTSGFTSANVSFAHFYQHWASGNGIASVSYSTDNGITWVPIQSFTANVGAANAFANSILPLPAGALNQTSVQVRFNHSVIWGYYWAVDNVSIQGTQSQATTWSPIANLFSDAAASVPYVANTSATTVYFKSPTASATTTYTATATTALGCFRTANVDVTVNPLPTVVTVNPAAVCSPSTVDLTTAAVTTGSDAALTFTYFSNAAATTALSNPNAVATSGTYFIKGTNANGCSAVTPVTVTINPLPVLIITNPASVCNPTTVDITASAVTTGSDSGLTLSYWSDSAATTSLTTPGAVTTSGTYYIKAVNTNGCEKIMPVIVTINVTPPPSGAATQVFCVAANITQLAATGTNVKWYDAATNGNFLPTISAIGLTNGATYYASQTLNGCEGERLAVTVTINPTPATPVGNAVQNITVPNAGDATLANIIVTGSGLIWFASEANAIAGVNPLPVGTVLVDGTTYYVVSSIGTCSSAPLGVTVNVTLDTNSFDTANFKYYPNPVTDILNLSYSEMLTNVEVFNMIGQQVVSKKLNSNTGQIDMSQLPSGTYVIKVSSDDTSKVFKVIKR